MSRRWVFVAALLMGIAALLVFVGSRIGDRERIAETGRVMLMPLVPLGPRDLSRGDRIELVYDLPDIQVELHAGTKPAEGTIGVTLDDADIVIGATFIEPGVAENHDVIVAYRFAPAGLGLWPSDRPRLSFGDGFFVVTEGRIGDYLDAEYAVLSVDRLGNSVVVGLARADAKRIRPEAD